MQSDQEHYTINRIVHNLSYFIKSAVHENIINYLVTEIEDTFSTGSLENVQEDANDLIGEHNLDYSEDKHTALIESGIIHEIDDDMIIYSYADMQIYAEKLQGRVQEREKELLKAYENTDTTWLQMENKLEKLSEYITLNSDRELDIDISMLNRSPSYYFTVSDNQSSMKIRFSDHAKLSGYYMHDIPDEVYSVDVICGLDNVIVPYEDNAGFTSGDKQYKQLKNDKYFEEIIEDALTEYLPKKYVDYFLEN
jgi:hypothetical protein